MNAVMQDFSLFTLFCAAAITRPKPQRAELLGQFFLLVYVCEISCIFLSPYREGLPPPHKDQEPNSPQWKQLHHPCTPAPVTLQSAFLPHPQVSC